MIRDDFCAFHVYITIFQFHSNVHRSPRTHYLRCERSMIIIPIISNKKSELCASDIADERVRGPAVMNLPHSRERCATVKGVDERPELYTVSNVVALIPYLSVTLFSLLYCTRPCLLFPRRALSMAEHKNADYLLARSRWTIIHVSARYARARERGKLRETDR